MKERGGGAVFKRQLFVLEVWNNSRIDVQNRVLYYKVFGCDTNRTKGNRWKNK